MDLQALQRVKNSDPEHAARLAREISRASFVPHTGQQAVLDSDARFRVVRAGRRFGKSKLAARELVYNAVTQSDQMVWCVANQYKNTRRIYREVVKQTPASFLKKPPASDRSSELLLEFKNGSRIEFYSGESPDSLAGEGVNFVVVDEAALIKENVWFQMIRPTLMDTGGRALIISTPRGKNWFWKLSKMGENPSKFADYAAWHFRQSDNPYIPQSETDEARESLPYLIYQQEIEAEFIDSAASIFRIPDEAVQQELWAPQGHLYMGVDLAKKEDYTVIDVVRGSDRRPCFHDRFNQISWGEQKRLIQATVEELEEHPQVEGVTIGMDSTGLGDVVYDDLDEAGLDIVPINFGSGETKRRMVMRLAADLERERAFILPEQFEEFSSYEYEITPAGKYKFEASSGHDDEVAAKMIQHWVMTQEGAPAGDALTYDRGESEKAAETDIKKIAPDSARAIMGRSAAWG